MEFLGGVHRSVWHTACSGWPPVTLTVAAGRRRTLRVRPWVAIVLCVCIHGRDDRPDGCGARLRGSLWFALASPQVGGRMTASSPVRGSAPRGARTPTRGGGRRRCGARDALSPVVMLVPSSVSCRSSRPGSAYYWIAHTPAVLRRADGLRRHARHPFLADGPVRGFCTGSVATAHPGGTSRRLSRRRRQRGNVTSISRPPSGRAGERVWRRGRRRWPARSPGRGRARRCGVRVARRVAGTAGRGGRAGRPGITGPVLRTVIRAPPASGAVSISTEPLVVLCRKALSTRFATRLATRRGSRRRGGRRARYRRANRAGRPPPGGSARRHGPRRPRSNGSR